MTENPRETAVEPSQASLLIDTIRFKRGAQNLLLGLMPLVRQHLGLGPAGPLAFLPPDFFSELLFCAEDA